jgi:hypothetical protein
MKMLLLSFLIACGDEEDDSSAPSEPAEEALEEETGEAEEALEEETGAAEAEDTSTEE